LVDKPNGAGVLNPKDFRVNPTSREKEPGAVPGSFITFIPAAAANPALNPKSQNDKRIIHGGARRDTNKCGEVAGCW
jgi:hypothetical protein